MWRRIVISALIGVALLGASCGPCRVPPPAAGIAGDSSGGIIAIYEIWQASDSYGRVYVQKISPEGGVPWGGEGVFIGSGCRADDQCESYAVSDGSGGGIVVWLERLPEPEGEPTSSDFQTHVARIDSEGNIKWQRDIPGVDQAIPDGSGGVISVYRAPHNDIAVLKVDSEGNLPWGEDGVSLNTGQCWPLAAASDNLGGIIVVGCNFEGGQGSVCVQRVDSGGSALWQTGGVQACTGPAEGAQVVSDGAGGAIVAYMRDIPCDDGRIGGYCDSDIYAQRIDAEGNVLWGQDGVPICAGPSHPNTPKIVTDGAGGAIISFDFVGSEVSAPGYFAFRAARIGADGHELWEQEADLWGGTIVSDGSGGVISVWDGEEGTSARAQRLDATGRELWGPDGITLALREGQWSLVAPDGRGGIFISWSAAEFKGCNLSEVFQYVQRIDAEGNLPWGDEGILLNP
jgi:hypothetical protein